MKKFLYASAALLLLAAPVSAATVLWSPVSGDATTIDNITIGQTTPAAGAFTDVTALRLHLDTGTKTAGAISGAVMLNKGSGKLTSEALTTAGLADYTLTLTDNVIASTDIVLCSVTNGTNTQGTIGMGAVTPGNGSATLVVHNLHATQALNGTIVISFVVVKN